MVFKKKDGPDADEYGPRIGVRLTRAVHADLKKQASDHGLTISDIVRKRCVGVKIVSKIDAQTIVELRRQGALLKHLVLERPGALDTTQVKTVLDEINAAIKQIAAS